MTLVTHGATVWVYVINCGDGSATPAFFATEEQARAYAAKDEEEMGEAQWSEDCITSHELIFDSDGVLQNPDVYSD